MSDKDSSTQKNESKAGKAAWNFLSSRERLEDAFDETLQAMSEAIGPIESFAEGVTKARRILGEFLFEQLARLSVGRKPQSVFNEETNTGAVPANAAETLQALLKDSVSLPDQQQKQEYLHRIALALSPDEARLLIWLKDHDGHPVIDVVATDRRGLNGQMLVQAFTDAGDLASVRVVEFIGSYLARLQALGLVILDLPTEALATRYKQFLEDPRISQKVAQAAAKKITLNKYCLRLTPLASELLAVLDEEH